MDELDALFDANPDIAAAVAGAYQILLRGVPTIAGFNALIDTALDTNFGSFNPTIEFNRENIFINIFTSLVTGNGAAAAAFEDMTRGVTLVGGVVERLYNAFVLESDRSEAGLAFLTRPEALAFYQQVAIDRGIPGPEGAVIAAAASILNIVVDANLDGIGAAINNLLSAVNGGSAQIPADGGLLTPIDLAAATGRDGVTFAFPDEIPSVRDDLAIVGFRESGEDHDKLDFSAFVGPADILKIPAGAGGNVDIGAHNVVIAAPGSGIHGGLNDVGAAIFSLGLSGDVVFIVDDDGIAGGSAEVYYFKEDEFMPSVGYVGVLVGVSAGDLTALNIA